MAFTFQKATRKSAKLRMALVGPPGSGKTYSALKVATYLGGPIAVVDTEHGSASKYAPKPGEEADPERGTFDFSTLELTSFHPKNYVEAMKAAEEAGFNVVILDSLSHAWVGKDGGLELHDRAVARQKVQNKYTAWAEVTPHQNALVEAMLQSGCHVIATMRARVEYVQEKDERTGKPTVRKVGMAPVQRDQIEYEFDVTGDLDMENRLVVGKTRCSAIAGQVYSKPGKEFAAALLDWLGTQPPREERAKAEPKPDVVKEEDARVSEEWRDLLVGEYRAATKMADVDATTQKITDAVRSAVLPADMQVVRDEYKKARDRLNGKK